MLVTPSLWWHMWGAVLAVERDGGGGLLCANNRLSTPRYSPLEKPRVLHGSALENRRKWYGLGVPRFFKRCGIWYLSLRYLMVRLPTLRFFKWYLVTVSQHCGKQMARYIVTMFLRGRQMARYMALRNTSIFCAVGKRRGYGNTG